MLKVLAIFCVFFTSLERSLFYFINLAKGFSLLTDYSTGKLQLTGQILGQVFNLRDSCMCSMHLCWHEAKWSNLKLKTRPKLLSGYLPLAFKLPDKYSLHGKKIPI
jgi:hypothetical protein